MLDGIAAYPWIDTDVCVAFAWRALEGETTQ